MSSHGLRRAPGGEKQTGDLEKENEGSKISLLGRECHCGIYFDSCESTGLKDFIRRNSVLYSSRKKKKYFCFVGFFFCCCFWAGKCECFGEATLGDILYLATVTPVCTISSDRACPGRRLKSRIMKYLADGSLLMGSRFAPGPQDR